MSNGERSILEIGGHKVPPIHVEEHTATIGVNEFIRRFRNEDSCSRICSLPCCHPDKVRPSLEAYGFDVSLISQELFGIELQWSKDGVLPECLLIVCDLFYNVPEKSIQIKL